MRKLLGFTFIAIIMGCSKNTNMTFSGKLDIPETIFEYSAIGKGIPCVTFTGAENLDKGLYPDKFLEHINLISVNPDNISENIINNLTLDDILNDIERVRKHLDIEKIAVMGHSMFSTLPLDYALKYPDNVLLAISTGSAPAFNNKYNQTVQDYWESFATIERKEIYQSRIDSLMKTDFASLSPGEQFIKQYIAGAPKYFYNATFDCSKIWNKVKVNMNFVNHYFGNIISKIDNSDKYKTIQVPVLIMSGKYDFACPHILWEGIVEEIPNAEYILFENAGHNPMLEIPEEFSQTVIKWIN